MRGITGRIDDRRMVGIQSPQSIDQGKGFGRAVHTGLTDGMVPCQRGDVCIEEKRSNGRSAGIQCKLCSPPKIENAFLRIRGWRLSVKEGPAAVEDRLSEFWRDVDRRQVSCAECRHEQDKLEVGHPWILDIER